MNKKLKKYLAPLPKIFAIEFSKTICAKTFAFALSLGGLLLCTKDYIISSIKYLHQEEITLNLLYFSILCLLTAAPYLFFCIKLFFKNKFYFYPYDKFLWKIITPYFKNPIVEYPPYCKIHKIKLVKSSCTYDYHCHLCHKTFKSHNFSVIHQTVKNIIIAEKNKHFRL